MRDFSIKKLYYSISEVSKITEVEQYVLRYWETEFEDLKPQKNRAGNRAYTNKDIQFILVIKHLLREKKYTIEGAKKIISESGIEPLIASSSPGFGSQEEITPEPIVEEVVHKTVPVPSAPEVISNRNPGLRKEMIELKQLLLEILKVL